MPLLTYFVFYMIVLLPTNEIHVRNGGWVGWLIAWLRSSSSSASSASQFSHFQLVSWRSSGSADDLTEADSLLQILGSAIMHSCNVMTDEEIGMSFRRNL